MYGLVYTTAGSRSEAGKIAKTLVNSRLAACVNYFPVTSTYLWNGKTESAGEYALICKTLKGNFNKIREKIKQVHSYETPCVLYLPVEKGDRKYLRWLRESLR